MVLYDIDDGDGVLGKEKISCLWEGKVLFGDVVLAL